ncbi:MAG: FAD:protein FMN transferase [Pseudomonadota bacterium]
MMRFLAITLLFVALTACGQKANNFTLTGAAMGTTYKVTVVRAPKTVDAHTTVAAIREVLAITNSHFSNWDSMSEISRFNDQQVTDPFAMSPPLQRLMATAQAVHIASEGRFDLTVGPLVELWGFGASGGPPSRPQQSQILDALQRVGQRRVLEIEDNGQMMRKTRPDAVVYLSSIAKGAGVDAVCARLRELGIEHYLVEIGGDLRVSGNGPSGAGWRIGIETPSVTTRAVDTAIRLTNSAMATSGDYRNYFDADGVRFSHVLDPTTGHPVAHRTTSVTVVADTAALADAWATALLVLGRDAGEAVAARYGIAAMFIERGDLVDGDASATLSRYASADFDRLLKADTLEP